jgi:hypothetical protein
MDIDLFHYYVVKQGYSQLKYKFIKPFTWYLIN